MPPAFNLSQDQTLQFDLFTSNSIDVGPIPIHIGYPSVDENKTCLHPCGLTRSGRSVFASCEHQNFLKCLPGFHRPRCCQRCLLWPGCPSTPVPTLIGCEFLKNRLARTDNRETPAERRDYTSKSKLVNSSCAIPRPCVGPASATPRGNGARTRIMERGMAFNAVRLIPNQSRPELEISDPGETADAAEERARPATSADQSPGTTASLRNA